MTKDQNPEWRSRLKKDPGIPNLFPYKDRILHEIEEKKRLKAEEITRRKEAVTGIVRDTAIEQETPIEVDGEDVDPIHDEDMDEDTLGDSSNPMAALLASARAQAAEYDDQSENDNEMDEDDSDGGINLDMNTMPSNPSRSQDSSRHAFDKIFQAVLSSSDIILYVLDARDPNGTRSREIEHQITAAEAGSKRLILILNKIDLVPPAALKAWLVHLRRYFPTLPLRASNPASNARTWDHKALTVKGTSETLFRALKSYAQSKNLKRGTTVGIVGYPNVGKSSVINALTSRLNSSRSKTTACPVGAEAGVTTSLREVKLDSKLKLLDSPGIVFPSEANSASRLSKNDEANLILLNALPPKQISDPVPAVTLLLSRLSTSPDALANLFTAYDIPALVPSGDGDTTTDFLVQVARKRGRLGKGGVPNLVSAAMTVVTDWRDGRIPGWVDAPKEEAGGERREIVKGWAEEFKLEGLWGDGKGEDEMVE